MADLRATFVRGQKHKLSVYIHQMCTLMMFNNAHRLNEKETGHGSIPDLQEEGTNDHNVINKCAEI